MDAIVVDGFKALSGIVSKDKARTALHVIAVKDAHTMEATDGHCLVRVTFKAPHGLPVGAYNPKRALAAIKASVAPPREDDALTGYPADTDRVIPAKSEQMTLDGLAGWGAGLVARVMEALDKLGATGPVVIQPPVDVCSAMRVDAEGDEWSAVAVVMPMRREPYKREGAVA